MEPFFSRYRNPLVLLALLVVQIVGLAVQVRRVDTGHSSTDSGDPAGVRLIRLWANAIVSPPERAIHSSKLGAGGFWQNYIDLRHIREQNQDLQKTIDRLRLEHHLGLHLRSEQGQQPNTRHQQPAAEGRRGQFIRKKHGHKKQAPGVMRQPGASENMRLRMHDVKLEVTVGALFTVAARCLNLLGIAQIGTGMIKLCGS